MFSNTRRHTPSIGALSMAWKSKAILNVQYTRTRRYLLIDSHAKCARTPSCRKHVRNSHWCWWYYHHQVFSLCSLHRSEVLPCSPYLPSHSFMHRSVQQSNCKRQWFSRLQSKRLTYGQADDAFNICHRQSLLVIIILIQKTMRGSHCRVSFINNIITCDEQWRASMC